jgi:MoaA/NifB/PqqE/SkfB family radical SAM enzyme
MIEKENIKIVHVEASSRCNSHCPMCSRYTADGFVQPNLEEGDLSAETFYKLFTKEFTRQLEHVYFSGVYGDPCLNRLLPEFVNYLMDNGCKSIGIDTNGGYRGETWWASLARDGVLINFAVDGTDNDTLQKYRMGVNYDKVIANMKSFVASGGQAQWNFIVFEHNEHQIDTAKQLSNEIGVKFRLKVTQKFRGKGDFKVMQQGQHVFTLTPPKKQEFRHSNVGTVEHVPITMFKFELKNFTKLNNNKISCKSQIRNEVYLTASGLLMPCCYLGTYTHDSPGSWQFNEIYNVTDFNLTTHSVDNVLNKFKEISNLWNNTIEENNLITCLHTCGNKENTTLYYDDKLTKENILKK